MEHAVGFRNIQQNCYANAVLQCFAHSPCMLRWAAKHPSLLSKTLTSRWIPAAEHSQHEVWHLLSALAGTHQGFKPGMQNDAQEFFTLLLDKHPSVAKQFRGCLLQTITCSGCEQVSSCQHQSFTCQAVSGDLPNSLCMQV